MLCLAIFCYRFNRKMLSLTGSGTGSEMLCPDGSNMGSGTLCPSSSTRHDDILGSGESLYCHAMGAHGRGLGDGHRAQLLSVHEWPWDPNGTSPSSITKFAQPIPSIPSYPSTNPSLTWLHAKAPVHRNSAQIHAFPTPVIPLKHPGGDIRSSPLMNPLSGIH